MNFKTADLSDQHGASVQVVLPGLRDYGGRPRFHGPMVTLKAHNDFSQVRNQLKSPGEGRVLVVDNAALPQSAMLGDLLAGAAVENGWSGVVINGCLRDSADIRDMALGIRALASVPARGENQGRGDVNVELSFLGAIFRPGEYLYCDEDGILLSPEALL